MKRNPLKIKSLFLWTFCIASVAFLFALSPQKVHAATLYLSPVSQNTSVGKTFLVQVEVSSPDQSINAVSGDLSFPTDKLEVLSISKPNSIVSLWIQNPSFSNSIVGGDVNFQGVVLNPGFTGVGGNIITVLFQAIGEGNAEITFSSGSVLANDGNGTNILTTMTPATLTIGSQVATSPSSQQLSASPAELSGKPFVIKENTVTDPTDPQPVFSWDASGVLSGVNRYSVKIGNGDWFNASAIAIAGEDGQYRLPLQAPGTNVPLTVEAVNASGMMVVATSSFTIAPLPSPKIVSYSKYISYPDQTLTMEGTAPSGTVVYLSLRKLGELINFTVSVNQDGVWSLTQNLNADSGIWVAQAKAVDSRGAESEGSASVALTITGWFGEVLSLFIQWGLLIIFGVLILVLVVFVSYYMVHRLRLWQVGKDREMLKIREEMSGDLERIEKELGTTLHSSRAALDAAGIKKKQEIIRKEIEHLRSDLKKDIKTIDDIEGDK